MEDGDVQVRTSLEETLAMSQFGLGLQHYVLGVGEASKKRRGPGLESWL